MVAIQAHLDEKRALMEAYQVVEEELPPDQIDDEPLVPEPVNQFGIYHVILELSDNDPRMLDYWYDKNIKELFKFLFYLSVKPQKPLE